MKHLGLFEGIGGFGLAARWAGWETIAWVEINPFCQQVLRKHFPEAEGHGDIKETDFKKYAGSVDIITGGFPCQPYSQAGKRLGKEDERHLWPEMLRAIREVQPRWIVGENVLGLVNWSGGMVFLEVQADLEAAGYEVQTYVLPACAKDAPHRRDRIWIVAHSNSGTNRNIREQDRGQDGLPEVSGQAIHTGEFIGTAARITPDTGSNGQQWSDTIKEINNRGFQKGVEKRPKLNACDGVGNTADTNNQGLQRSEINGSSGRSRENGNEQPAGLLFSDWENFPTVAPLCGRNDGISNRVDRLKALGNAVVPQVVYEIFKAINQMEAA